MYIKRSLVMDFIRDLLEVIVAFVARINQESRDETKAQALARVSAEWIGRDASPEDEAPDELGCAESLSKIINRVVPFPTEVSTIKLQKRLEMDVRFERQQGRGVVGDVMVIPTGTGTGRKTGHCWICHGNDRWASNSSFSGTWELNYDYETIKRQWVTEHKMPMYIYSLVV